MKTVKLYESALLLSTVGAMLTGCNGRNPNLRAPIVDGNEALNDPAAANLPTAAPTTPGTRVAGVSYAAVPQSSGTSYPAQQQQGGNYGSGNSAQNEAYRYNTQPPQGGQYEMQPAQGEPDDPNASQQGYDNGSIQVGNVHCVRNLLL